MVDIYSIRHRKNRYDKSNGSIAFIKQTKHLDPGDVGIFILNNEIFLKVLGDSSDILKSINKNYSDIKITPYDECRLVGKVVGNYVKEEN